MLKNINRRFITLNRTLIRQYVQTANRQQDTEKSSSESKLDLIKEKQLNNPEELGWHQNWVPAEELKGANEQQQKVVLRDEFQHDW